MATRGRQAVHEHPARRPKLIDAVDTWTASANGQPVPVTEAADAVNALTDVAGHAPSVARPGGIARGHYAALLEPAQEWLTRQGVTIRSDRGIELERRGRELGIEL